MKLSEKIYTCRKKAGLSQEALAEKIGISRQAISKWELGEAEPEIRKLKLLAEVFGVSTDWLLSDEPEKYSDQTPDGTHTAPPPAQSWIDSVPGVIGRLLRRYGWLFGVRMAVSGAGIAFIGFLARTLSKSMFSSFFNLGSPFGNTFPQLGQAWTVYDSSGNLMNVSGFSNDPFAGFATNNPVYIMGGVLIVLGIVLLIAGIILAIVLKEKKKNC